MQKDLGLLAMFCQLSLLVGYVNKSVNDDRRADLLANLSILAKLVVDKQKCLNLSTNVRLNFD